MLLASIYLIICLTSSISSEIINVSVNRSSDLHTQLVKIKTQVVFHKNGNENSSTYTYLIDSEVEFYNIKFTNSDGVELIHHRNGNHIDVFYNKEFVNNIDEILNVEEVHLHQVNPTFKKQSFGVSEAVWYEGNSCYYSLYKTLESNTTFSLDSGFKVDVVPTFMKHESALYYSKNIQPFTNKLVRFDFFMNEPLLAATNLERMIDVSHFGFITVTDEVHLKNMGADMYGPYEFTPNNWIYTHLPASAENVAMFDKIGLRYNYEVHKYETHKTLQFKTRYPLRGGWQTSYTLTYTVPTYEYLTHTNHSTFQLSMRVFDHILNDIIIHSFTTKVILPENCQNFELDVPRRFETETALSITHLSCFGRPTVVIRGGEVVEGDQDVFTIKYDFEQVYLLRVPLKLALFYFIMLISIVTSVRLPGFFALSRNSGPCCK